MIIILPKESLYKTQLSFADTQTLISAQRIAFRLKNFAHTSKIVQSRQFQAKT